MTNFKDTSKLKTSDDNKLNVGKLTGVGSERVTNTICEGKNAH